MTDSTSTSKTRISSSETTSTTTTQIPTILIIGTLNTKQPELIFLRDRILSSSNGSCRTKILDISVAGTTTTTTTTTTSTTEIQPTDLLTPLHLHSTNLTSLPRGDYVNQAIQVCTPIIENLITTNSIQGIIAIGGSTGSSIATALMRHQSCPVGFPKLMVSTMASGDVGSYVGETDITMMYSVVDIAGLNSILEVVLSNAAAAVVGMVVDYSSRKQQQAKKKEKDDDDEIQNKNKRIAITMFGVTTPCVDLIRSILTSPPPQAHHPGYEIYVFHATGSGGRAMERLISESQIDAVIDLTTTEIPDELFGGVLSAGPNRLEAASKKGIPMIVSVGACDMVNFGPKDTVPEKYKGRKLYVHNPGVTLMRTNIEENKIVGEYIAGKLKAFVKRPEMVEVVLPKRGVSMIDVVGQPFWDREADEVLFGAVKNGLRGSGIEVLEMDEHINDEGFAREVCGRLVKLMG